MDTEKYFVKDVHTFKDLEELLQCVRNEINPQRNDQRVSKLMKFNKIIIKKVFFVVF